MYATHSFQPATSGITLPPDALIPATPQAPTRNESGARTSNRSRQEDPWDHDESDTDLLSSEPSLETRHFPDASDSDDEVVVIDGSRPFVDKSTQALQDALVGADLDRLKNILSEKPTLVNRSIEVLKCTPLVAAIEMRQADIVDYLLSVPGINLNTSGSSRITPLHAACIGGDIALAKRLLRIGARANTCDGFSTPLIAACTHGDASLVKKILQRTSKNLVDFRHSGGHTAMTAAIESDNRDAVKLLLRKGANPNFRNPKDMTPLHHAAKHGHTDIAKLLIRFGAVQASTASGMPGNLACDGNHALTLAVLLKEASPDVLRQGLWLNYAMMGAVANEATDCIEVLLRADSDMLSENGSVSLLMGAVSLNRPRSVQVLLRHGADPNYLTRFGNSPLSSAIMSEASMDLVLMLVSALGRRVILPHDLALKLVHRARDAHDFRVLNELATRQIENEEGQLFDLQKALNS